MGFAWALTALAQPYLLSTLAGGAPPPASAFALASALRSPGPVATDAAGNVYFAALASVFKLTPGGTLSRVAGNSRSGYSGDGAAATKAQLWNPSGLAVDADGNIYVADTGRIRRVSPDGVVTTVAGSGMVGSAGDGGPAVAAAIEARGIAADGGGNLYVAGGGRVRKVSPDGLIATVAGGGGALDEGAAALDANMDPAAVCVDAAGKIYIAETARNRVRVIADGVVKTIAGTGERGHSGDGGSAVAAKLNLPNAIAVDAAGIVYVAEDTAVRQIYADGSIGTVAGQGWSYEEGVPAALSALGFVRGVAVDSAGAVYLASSSLYASIRMIDADGTIFTIAGGAPGRYSGDGGRAVDAELDTPVGIAVDESGAVYIGDAGNGRIRKVTAAGTIGTLAGGDGIAALAPAGLALDAAGNLYMSQDNQICRVSPTGSVSRIAGSANNTQDALWVIPGPKGYSGDGGPAAEALLNAPGGLAVDRNGNVYFADTGNHRVRRISNDGVVTTVAGSGTMGNSGDGGPAISAQLTYPDAVAADSDGTLYIADRSEARIRKVLPDGSIASVAAAGAPVAYNDSGAAGPMRATGLAIDRQHNLYATDLLGNRVVRIGPDGAAATLAGAGATGYFGDGGAGWGAGFSLAADSGIAVDGLGRVYVADTGNDAVRVLQQAERSPVLSAVVDAAAQQIRPVSPGKIVVLYGSGMGPAALAQNQAPNGRVTTELAGTKVTVNGLPAPILYTCATQVAAIVPYAVTGTTAQFAVAYQSQISGNVAVPLAATSPAIFTSNQTGAGQVAALNYHDASENLPAATVNTAANPIHVGDFVAVYVSGEGQTTPAGVDGNISSGPVFPRPNANVSAKVGGIAAAEVYAVEAPASAAGLMQVNIRIPAGVKPGGYVPVSLTVGSASTPTGAVWIAVAAK